jgi:gliding motility-associated-like protein
VCNTTIYKDISIEPIGSITLYEIFTPDGDGKNDEYGVDILHYENFSIQIYDRENRCIFLSQSPDYKWNGKINNEGADCPSDEYYAKISYQLKGESPQVKSIKITLIR